MRRLFCLLFTLLITNSFSQILEPVKWEARTEPVINSDLEYDIIFTAIVDDKWAIYSQNVEEGGPLPPIVSFSASNDYKLVGLTIESDLNKETKFDSVFQMTVSKFYNKAIFSQRIKIQNPKKMFEVQGNIEFMSCDDSRIRLLLEYFLAWFFRWFISSFNSLCFSNGSSHGKFFYQTNQREFFKIRFFKSHLIWLFYCLGLFNFKLTISFNRINQP